jgi:endonuclease-8
MPEGDTIFRTAVTLRTAIEGHNVQSLWSRESDTGLQSLVGHRISAVEARRKHLLMHIGDRRVLHSHLGMTGSWHLYRPGEPWTKPARRAAVSMQFPSVVAVCFSPKTLELLSPAAFRRHMYLHQLGPDILGNRPHDAEILRRFRAHDQTTIGEALLNQTILCGIGNVYKSEVLFVARIHPFDLVAQTSDEVLLKVVSIARELMRRNLQGYPRRTRLSADRQRQWVYNRKHQPCFVCGASIQMQRQGDLGRSTYWCPSCQRR